MTRPGERVYRLLLLWLPRSARARYGDEMVELFRGRRREVRGWRGAAGLWMRAVADVARHGSAERFHPSHGDTPTRRKPPSPETAFQNLRFALRILFKAPGFTVVVVTTLALGIGAATALFSVVDGVLLRPLSYPHPDRLVFLQEADERGRALTVSYPNFADWRQQATSFDVMISGFPAWESIVYGLGDPVPVKVMGVSRAFFETLGAEPILGRVMRHEESLPESDQVLVVSHAFWSRHLGSNPNLEELALDFGGGGTAPVIGVLSPDFRYLDDVDVWYAYERNPIQIRNAHNHWVVGRLRAGVSLARAREEMSVIAARIKRAFPDDSGAASVAITPLHDEIVGDSSRPLWLLMAASALLLLVACTNVASTLLARGAERRQEVAIRRALGAGRGRIVAQLLTEAGVLASLGALGGLALASAAVRLLQVFEAGRIPRLGEVSIDERVLGFCIAATVATVVLFGLFPALRLSREAGRSLRSEGRSTGGRSTARLWRGLVGTEVALAVVLLIGSGLLIRSLDAILTRDTGFDRDNVAILEFSLPRAPYRDNAARLAFFDRLKQDLASIPGVQAVGLVNALPVADGFKTGPVVKTPYVDPGDPDEWDAMMRWRVADAGYFDALGIEVLQGRTFDSRDVESAPGVAIVNEPLAEHLWPGESPLGKRLRATWDFRGEDLEVVGVVNEARHWGREPGSQNELYVPYAQRPEHADAMVATLRTSVVPSAVSGAARARLRAIDKDVLGRFSTLDAAVFETLGDRTFTITVLGAFSGAALLLALVGIYGVVSYSVARRTHEIGVRLALGAEPEALRTLIQGQAMLAVVAGLAAGVAGALGAGRIIEALLFDVRPTDPATFASVVAGFLAVAALASYVPARRSTRIDPVRALRAQ